MVLPPIKLSSKLEFISPTSSKSTEERNLFLGSGLTVTVLPTVLLMVLTVFSPGVLAADGMTQVLSSHLFFNFPGPPNFLLSKQNLHSPQSFILHAEQLLHGIFLLFSDFYVQKLEYVTQYYLGY